MSFPKYEAYKESGVEWLGEVPECWNVSFLKNYVSTINGFGFSSSDFKDEGIPFIRAGNIKNKSIRPPETFLPREVVQQYKRVILEGGDIVISMVGSDPKIIESAVGQIGLVPNSLAGAVPNQNVVILRENNDVLLKRFLFYSLLSNAYRHHLNVFSHKLANQSIISSSLLVSAKFSYPELEEQTQIAQFLDHETDRIDTLIAEQQRLIELLKEKRQAVISHAVTKGLDPTVPMKDSGVEWLGEVPKHWEVKRFKFLVSDIEGGFSPQCFAYPPNDEEWGVLKSGCVNGGIFNSQESKALPGEVVPPHELEVFQGDILMSRASGSRDLIGSVAMVYDQPKARLLLSDKTFRLKLKLNIVDPDFFVSVMGSPVVRRQIRQCISGAEGLANNISQSNIKELILPFPPQKEQKSIVQTLKDQFQVINSLSNTATLTLSLLQEHRSALISATVTGKIDVQAWQVPASV